MLKTATQTAKVGSFVTEAPGGLKTATQTAEVSSLSDEDGMCHTNCRGRQFYGQLEILKLDRG